MEQRTANALGTLLILNLAAAILIGLVTVSLAFL